MNTQAKGSDAPAPAAQEAGAPFAALRSPEAIKVLRERARRLAERSRSATAAARRDLIVVRCGSARYAFELSRLAGVHRAPPITSLPDATRPCLGVAVVSGHVHAVFDLGAALGEPPVTPEYLTLVSARADQIVAFAVAEIMGTEATRRLGEAPADANTAVRGVTEDLTAVLDVDALIGALRSGMAGDGASVPRPGPATGPAAGPGSETARGEGPRR